MKFCIQTAAVTKTYQNVLRVVVLLIVPKNISIEEVGVFVTDPTTLDLEVYELWLKGFSGGLLWYFLTLH